MENLVTLSNYHTDGSVLSAQFDPLRGMNDIFNNQESSDSRSNNQIFVRAEKCWSWSFNRTSLPSSHSRSYSNNFPKDLFPHLLHQNKEQLEPFSHGIARYVPWHYEASSTQIKAWLSGSDIYKGLPLKTFEGFDFSMRFEAILLHDGLLLDYSIESQEPSVIGFHYYYSSSPDDYVEGLVKPFFRQKAGWDGIQNAWYDQESSKLHFSLNQEADYGFMPLQDPNSSSNNIYLKTPKHKLMISYTSSNEDETSWQLFHPKGASYVCLEPLSALNPFAPVLKRNRLQMKISYF